VSSIALIHEKLYESKDLANINFGEYVRTLTAQLLDSIPSQSSAVRLTTNAADVFLEVSKAIPCALMINELVTNSIKYGFPGNQNREKEGEINVELKSPHNGKVTLIISDNGVGLPGDFDLNKTETLGMQIIKALIKKLHGTIEIDKNEGTKFIIQFQIENKRTDDH
jgi:two-component sensor histidine kinase